MQIITRRIPAGALLLVLVQLAGSAFAQPQSPEQQRCITALNGGFAKVAKARSKAVVRCAKAAQKGEAFAACLAEQQQKLDKALAKLASTESKKCSAAPDFGPADLGALGSAGTDLATYAATDLFGAAPGNAIADKKQEKETARCQLGVAKAAQKCALARVQAFNRCKKAGLKSGSIASAADLAACLDDDAGGRLAKSCTAKLAKAAARCDAVDIAEAFPACGANDATGLADCADGRLVCRARDALAAADGMTVPGCGSITPEAEIARAATADIGPEGGEVSAVGGDGTVYRLSVPSGALLFETAITITPVSAIPDLPLTGGLLAAVEFAPDGLQLWAGATLTIELPSAPDPADLAGFGWQGAGDGVHLALVAVEGSTLTLGVTHFSGTGAAIVAPENLAALQALPPGSVEQQYFNQTPAGNELDPLVWVTWLSAWFDGGVKPLLEGAMASDEALLAGLDAFVVWQFAAESGAPSFLGVDPNFFLGLDGFALANRIDEGLALAAPALREGVIRNDVECVVEEDLAYAEAELRWQGIAQSLGLATEENGLDLATVMEDFCVELLYDDITYPQSPQAGVAATLHVEVGYSIGGEPIQFDQDMHVFVEPTGTVEGAGGDFFFEGDDINFSYTPTGNVELVFDVGSCLFTPDDYPALLGKVCQTAIVVRGFEVQPEDATLEPGEEFPFDALLYGEPHPSVTWTATGGEISQTGVYTAGDVAGEFSVTATSNFSGISETAVITIGDGAGPSLVFDVVTFGGTAFASGSNCDLPFFLSDDVRADITDYPSFALAASQGNGGSGTGSASLTVDVDEATGVITITAFGGGTASGGAECPDSPGATSGQGAGAVGMEFNFDPGDTAYEFDITGSVSGSGDYEVWLQFFPERPSANAAGCRITESGNLGDPSCPGGNLLSGSGPLPAGTWNLNVRAPAQAFRDFPSSSTFYDFTLTLSPQ